MLQSELENGVQRGLYNRLYKGQTAIGQVVEQAIKMSGRVAEWADLLYSRVGCDITVTHCGDRGHSKVQRHHPLPYL